MMEQIQQMGGEPEVVQREAQLTHHLQQSDGAMRINTQNRAAYSNPTPLSVRIMTVLKRLRRATTKTV
jgi:predicted transcriptional regulator